MTERVQFGTNQPHWMYMALAQSTRQLCIWDESPSGGDGLGLTGQLPPAPLSLPDSLGLRRELRTALACRTLGNGSPWKSHPMTRVGTVCSVVN